LVLLAKEVIFTNAQVPDHVYSTLFAAADVNQYLSTDQGISGAIQWCQAHGITKKIYIESWRDGILVEKQILQNAKKRFEDAGYTVWGCICTTKIGKPSTGWNLASCYTNTTTQEKLNSIFSYTATIFDTIIIDDFYFTDCTCNECTAAQRAHEVVVGDHHVHYDDMVDKSCYEEPCLWKDYRRNLMYQISRWAVLEPANQANPNVTLIIKYPDWYDVFQDFGYDTAAQSALFPKIWVGTEFRNYPDAMKPPYFAFFNMRWLGGIGAEKCGGGWYDPFDTSTATYVEQARMTVLGGAKESFLFVYSALLNGEGLDDVNALYKVMPELIKISGDVRSRSITGVAAYKPPNSHGGCILDPQHSGQCKGETYVFDFVGMLGIPLVPTFEFPDVEKYSAAFFSTHALKDDNLVSKLQMWLAAQKPTLVTDKLKQILGTSINLDLPFVRVLPVNEYPPSLLTSPPVDLDMTRMALLKPLGLQFSAPVNTSFFPFTDGSWIVENFADKPVVATINGESVNVDGRGWVYKWK